MKVECDPLGSYYKGTMKCEGGHTTMCVWAPTRMDCITMMLKARFNQVCV